MEMWTPPPDQPIVISCTADALEFACVTELFRPFERLLALADGDGHVRVVVIDPTDSFVRHCGAIGLAVALLVSHSAQVDGPLRERDIETYRALVLDLAAQLVVLVDWIQISDDGQLLRSMEVSTEAYST